MFKVTVPLPQERSHFRRLTSFQMTRDFSRLTSYTQEVDRKCRGEGRRGIQGKLQRAQLGR